MVLVALISFEAFGISQREPYGMNVLNFYSSGSIFVLGNERPVKFPDQFCYIRDTIKLRI